MQALIFAASLLLAANYGGSSQRIHGTVTPASSVTYDPNNAAAALSLNGNELFWCNAGQCTVIPSRLWIGNSGVELVPGGSNLGVYFNGSITNFLAYAYYTYRPYGGPWIFNSNAQSYGPGNQDAFHLNFYANGVSAVAIDQSQNANFRNSVIVGDGNTIGAAYDKYGNGVPTNPNTASYYFTDEFEHINNLSGYFYAGGNYATGVNAITAPFITASSPGVIYVNTSSATQGGIVAGVGAYPIVKSATINYQWRVRFYMPAASTSANRYIAYIGAVAGSGTPTPGYNPFAGPYIAYTDNANSGFWTLNSAISSSTVSASTTVAPGFSAWHNLTIALANGVYTFTMDGVSLGTVSDATRMATSPATGQTASYVSIVIVPDGTNYTTQESLAIDRADVLITGLAR